LDTLYALLNRANEVGKKDIDKSATMIRNGVPPIADRFEASYPKVRRALLSLHLRTVTGRRVRTFALELTADNRKSLNSLRENLRVSDEAWGAVAR
jgi:hypothetical protein